VVEELGQVSLVLQIRRVLGPLQEGQVSQHQGAGELEEEGQLFLALMKQSSMVEEEEEEHVCQPTMGVREERGQHVQGAGKHVQRSGQSEQHGQERQEPEVSGLTWGEEAGRHVQQPEEHVKELEQHA